MSGFLNAVAASFVLLFDAVVCFGLTYVVTRFMVRHAPSPVVKVIVLAAAVYVTAALLQHFIAALGALL